MQSSVTDDGLCSALYPEFATEVIDVSLDRIHTQDELLGDLAVRDSYLSSH
jgi:hypothetical protein